MTTPDDHHRRNPNQPLTTRGVSSRIATIRLPYDLEAAIKALAVERDKPWQTVLKDLLYEALGLSEPSTTETKRVSSAGLLEASKILKARSKLF
jgi:hypothetical protein